jgi:RNA polymerase sigma factor (sigma-70 family)
MISKEEQERRENLFDAYIKKVLKFAYAKYCRDNKSSYLKEYSVEELTDELLAEYLSAENHYEVCNYKIESYIISIENDELCKQLDLLNETYRKITLLYYSEGLTDLQISDILGIERKTVNRYRHKALKFLKENMYYER